MDHKPNNYTSIIEFNEIVIKPGSGIDLLKRLDPGLHGLTRINLDQPGKVKKKIFEISIFHIKKLRNNPCGYKLKDYFKRFFYITWKMYYLIFLS
jgi:hypothetical protein